MDHPGRPCLHSRAKALPGLTTLSNDPEEEITRLRRLIRRVSENLESLTPGEQAEIHAAITAVRKTRQASLGIPRVRQPLADVRPERPA
jgi:hypothetical protein